VRRGQQSAGGIAAIAVVCRDGCRSVYVISVEPSNAWNMVDGPLHGPAACEGRQTAMHGMAKGHVHTFDGGGRDRRQMHYPPTGVHVVPYNTRIHDTSIRHCPSLDLMDNNSYSVQYIDDT
jgi:hypothetical protein